MKQILFFIRYCQKAQIVCSSDHPIMFTFCKLVAQMLSTQGNYATPDSSGMCHLMPRRHMPGWGEEDERVFVHCGSSGLKDAMTSYIVYHQAFQSVVRYFIVTSCKCSKQ